MKWLKEKKYYREYLKCWGWGVMLGYDTVYAGGKLSASIISLPNNMYASDKSFETIERIRKEHLNLTDEELSKIYGHKEE